MFVVCSARRSMRSMCNLEVLVHVHLDDGGGENIGEDNNEDKVAADKIERVPTHNTYNNKEEDQLRALVSSLRVFVFSCFRVIVHGSDGGDQGRDGDGDRDVWRTWRAWVLICI
jgi:hypothetical protein